MKRSSAAAWNRFGKPYFVLVCLLFIGLSVGFSLLEVTRCEAKDYGTPFKLLQKQVDELIIQFESLGVSVSDDGQVVIAPSGDLIIRPSGEFLVETKTTMKGDSTFEGTSEMLQELNVQGDTTVQGNTTLEKSATVLGNADFLKDLKVNGRLTLPNTAARVDQYSILEPIVPDAPLSSTVNIIEPPSSIDGYLNFIPRPPEEGTMMTLTYSPLTSGGQLDFDAPPVTISNCKNWGCSLETDNIRLKQKSFEYRMNTGSTITIVNGMGGIWYEISRSSAQVEVFTLETETYNLGPEESTFGKIDCVLFAGGDENAIMLVASVNLNGNDDLEVLEEFTGEEQAPTFSFERYHAKVRNNSVGPGPSRPFTIIARCMIP